MRRDPIRLLAAIFGGLGAVFLVLGIGLGLALPAFIGPLMFLTFGLVGGIFLCVGLGFAVHLRRRRLLREDLLRHGERIEAEILGLEPNPNIRINGRHPMRLVCRYTEDGVDCICRSETTRARRGIRWPSTGIRRIAGGISWMRRASWFPRWICDNFP